MSVRPRSPRCGTSSWTKFIIWPTGSADRCGRRSSSTCRGASASWRCPATVSNVEDFSGWLSSARGETALVVSEHRPVPLEQHVLVQADDRTEPELIDLYRHDADGRPTTALNAHLVSRLDQLDRQAARRAGNRDRGRERRRAGRTHQSQRQTGTACAAPLGRGRRTRLSRSAAGHHVHLLPQRLRPGRGSVPERRTGADHRGRGAAYPPHRR